MTAITLETFRDRIREIGEYENSGVFTTEMLNRQINDAVGEYCDMLDELFEGYRDTTGTLATVPGTATVAVPSDFLKVRAVDVLDGDRYRPLELLAIGQTYRFGVGRGSLRGYMHVGANLELFPTPDAAYTLRLRYLPTAPILVDEDPGEGESLSIDIPNGWEKFIIYTVLAVLDERDEKPNDMRLAECDRIRARVSRAAKTRNVAGPRYVPFPGEGGWGIP